MAKKEIGFGYIAMQVKSLSVVYHISITNHMIYIQSITTNLTKLYSGCMKNIVDFQKLIIKIMIKVQEC